MELRLHSRNTPSWSGAQLKKRDDITFSFTFTNVDKSLLYFSSLYTVKGNDKCLHVQNCYSNLSRFSEMNHVKKVSL
jgi:hypothetical protein